MSEKKSPWLIYKRRSALKKGERVCPLLTSALMVGANLGKLPFKPVEVITDDPVVGVCPGELAGLCGMENLCDLYMGEQPININTGGEGS